jgi:hypothetical protein
MIFLRGHASSQWLNAVGQKHNVDPELFQRHLHKAFGPVGRDLYSSPSLPSSSSNVFQLTVSTICFRNTGASSNEPEDLQGARRASSDLIARYFQDLRTRANVADSMVRKYLLLSAQEYVLEQTITVEVGSLGSVWRALIWLDIGRDLSKCAHGPWSPLPGTASWETYFSPVIVHQTTSQICKPSDTSRSTSSLPLLASPLNAQPDTRSNPEWKANQNMCQLPFEYGTEMDRVCAPSDALYSLRDLFQFAASSELQFLNLLQSRIEHELSIIGKQALGRQHAVALLNLKYIKSQLTAHAQRLDETVTLLENHHTFGWPSSPDSETAKRTSGLLLLDFRHLLRRAGDLSKECEQGMATLANSSILEESRRMTDNAERVRKLTILATTFIPLTFTCSLYGMNFVELGTGDLRVWVWFVTAVPVSLLSFFIYYFDVFIRRITDIVKRK